MSIDTVTGQLVGPELDPTLMPVNFRKEDYRIIRDLRDPDGDATLYIYYSDYLETKDEFAYGAKRWLAPGDEGYQKGIDPWGIFGDFSPDNAFLKAYMEKYDDLARDNILDMQDFKWLDEEYQRLYDKFLEEQERIEMDMLANTYMPETPSGTLDTVVSDASSGLSGGDIAGIVIGSLAFFGIFGFLLWKCRSHLFSRCGYKALDEETSIGGGGISGSVDTTSPGHVTAGGTHKMFSFRRRLPALEAKPSGFAIQNSVLILSCFTQVLWIVLGYFLFKRYKKSRADAARREMVIPLHD